jgi:hypothetical protein
MAESQDIVKANLAAHETFARIKHTEMQIELEKQKAAHTVQIQNAELDHQMNIDWNKMQNEWDLLPLEMRRIELANEAQDIENEWAADEAKAGLEGTELENAAKRKQLEESKNLGAYERSRREYVKGGGAPKNFVWGGPAFTTPQGLQGRKAIDARMDQESAAKRNQGEAEEHNAIWDVATPSQQGLFDETEAVPGQPGARRSKYMNANGNGYNEKGQALLRRLERQQKIELTDAERDTLREFDDVGHESPWIKNVNGDAVVLNDAGLIEYEGRRAMTKSLWRETGKTVDSTGKTVITYEKPDKKIEDAVMKSYTAWKEAQIDKSLEPTDAQIKGWESTAIGIYGEDLTGRSKAEVKTLIESGKPVFVTDPDGTKHVVGKGGVTSAKVAGPDGVLGTDDDVGGGGGGGGTSSSTELATSMRSSKDKHTEEGEAQLAGYDNMGGTGLTTDGGGGYNTTDFNRGNLPHIGDIVSRLQLSADKVDPLAGDTYEGKGYGATPEEAKEIADLLKQRYIDPVAGSEGGSDERFVSERESVNMAIDYYSDKHVNPHRKDLAELLNMNSYLDTASTGWAITPFGRSGGPGTNQTSAREADEIISTEIGDSTVRLKGGKVIKIREFVKLPAHEMLGARLFIPYALENKDDGSEPNEPTEGNIHGKGRRRTLDSGRNRTVGVTLFPYHFKDNIGAIKTTLTELIENGDHLTGLGNKFLRYKDGEYD